MGQTAICQPRFHVWILGNPISCCSSPLLYLCFDRTLKTCSPFLIPFRVFPPLILQAYEKQKQAQKSSSRLESKSEEREKVERFKTRENSIVSKPINPFTSGTRSLNMMHGLSLCCNVTRGVASSSSRSRHYGIVR